MNLHRALHDGSLWLVFVCLSILVGVAIGLFTDAGSGIAHHPYTKADSGGELASDLPPESIGRPQLEPRLTPHAAGRGRRGRGGTSVK